MNLPSGDVPPSPSLRKPRDEEIDVFGLTHPGKVRPNNQDHFLLATVHRRLAVVQTSLTNQERLRFPEERMAFLAMIADGVGGTEGGEEASRLALETATSYINESLNSYRGSTGGVTFENALQDAAMVAHAAVQERLKAEPDLHSMATTLTLWLGVWPW